MTEAAQNVVMTVLDKLNEYEDTVEEEDPSVSSNELEVLRYKLTSVRQDMKRLAESADAPRAAIAEVIKAVERAEEKYEEVAARTRECYCEQFDDVESDPKTVADIRDFMARPDFANLARAGYYERAGWSKEDRDIGVQKNDEFNKSLTKIQWGKWAPHLISLCLNRHYKVPRTDTVDKWLAKANETTQTPFQFTAEDIPSMSSTAVRTMHRILPHVRLDSEKGSLHFLEGTRRRRILTSDTERRAVFAKYWHDPGMCAHRGRTTTHRRFLESFLGITRAQVEMYIKETEVYQVSSKHKVIPKVVKPIATTKPMQHWQIDLVDMSPWLSKNKPFRYILVIVDLFSKFLWARPLKDKTPQSVQVALDDVFHADGFPEIVQSDGGSEFVSNADYLRKMGIIFRHGRAYKPSSQGQVERTNRTLKQSMYMDMLATENYRWVDKLPARVYAYNTMVHSSIQVTPFEIHRGRAPAWVDDARKVNVADAVTSRLDVSVADSPVLRRTLSHLQQNRELPEILQLVTPNNQLPSWVRRDNAFLEFMAADERMLLQLNEMAKAGKTIPAIVTDAAGRTFTWEASMPDRDVPRPEVTPVIVEDDDELDDVERFLDFDDRIIEELEEKGRLEQAAELAEQAMQTRQQLEKQKEKQARVPLQEIEIDEEPPQKKAKTDAMTFNKNQLEKLKQNHKIDVDAVGTEKIQLGSKMPQSDYMVTRVKQLADKTLAELFNEGFQYKNNKGEWTMYQAKDLIYDLNQKYIQV
jgi:transposase-like protein